MKGEADAITVSAGTRLAELELAREVSPLYDAMRSRTRHERARPTVADLDGRLRSD
ncbi:MAG TPA: hypothetical protein VM580_30340 [Labilithrix sp.]|jgi:hypothetical protein|nr:hypothetical protein [Labilithrix sp.]